MAAADVAAAAPAPSEHLPCTEAHVLRGHEGAVLNVVFNTLGTYCLSCGKDRTLRLWNPHKGLHIKTYAGHGYEVRDASVAADNATFASVGGDRQGPFLWDVGSGRVVRKFRGHDATINAVAHGAADGVLVTGGADQCVKVWDLKSRSPDPVQSMRAAKDDVTSVRVRGAEIVAGSVDGTVRRFDVRMGRAYADDLGAPVACVALSHDGLCVLAACLDSTLRLLDKASGELLASYTGHEHADVRMACALTASDAHVIGSSERGDVLYWDLVDAHLVRRFRAHDGVVCSLAARPPPCVGDAPPCLVTCSVDGTVKVWV